MKNFRYYFVYFFLLFIFFYSGCGNTSGPDYPPGAVKGKIIDLSNNAPLAGATITLKSQNIACISDTAGNYVLGNIQMGTSAIDVYVIASCIDYISDTISVVGVHSNDTVTVNFSLAPSNGIYTKDDIHIQEYIDNNSYNSINLGSLISAIATSTSRDVDLRDSAGARLKFRLVSAYSSGQIPVGLSTKFADSVGYFAKSEFDTLAMFYGASVPISPNDFQRTKTNWFYASLQGSPVYPFYLEGRGSIYGLLYIKSAYIENSIFNLIVDVKINTNGQNYFIIK
jgi:hypothetical protein